MTETTHNGVRLRELPDFDGYFAGEDGGVYSTKSGLARRLKEQVPKRMKGLRVVSLYREDKRYERRLASGRVRSCVRPCIRYVHHLIAAAWLPPRPSPRHEIDHKDECRANNRPDNLRWLTKQQNIRAYFERHPDSHQGSNNAQAKLCEGDIPAIRALRGVWPSPRVAELFGVTKATVQSVWRGKTWRHVA